jgi:hypothetical protein
MVTRRAGSRGSYGEARECARGEISYGAPPSQAPDALPFSSGAEGGSTSHIVAGPLRDEVDRQALLAWLSEPCLTRESSSGSVGAR